MSADRARERVIAGGPNDFVTVRHLSIHGSNYYIGKTIGELTVDRYKQTADRYLADPVFARARRKYFQREYPVHWERMRGAAAAFAVDPEDDRYDLSALLYHVDIPFGRPGCSVVYYPPASTKTGGGYLSRNYDFPTGSMADLMRIPVPAELRAQIPPVMSEPYLMEWYPEDGGYSSIAMHAFDPLSGTLDGINSAGLAVSILADDEAIGRLGPNIEMHLGPSRNVGLHELQVMRFVLDTCATAEEARDALLAVKDFYSFVPNHYIVADVSGRSFIFEHSTGRNSLHVFEGTGAPQVVTNYEVYRHPEGDPLFAAKLSMETEAFWRRRTLSDLIAQRGGSVTPSDMKEINGAVNIWKVFTAMAGAVPADGALPSRTLWHGLYDQAARSLDVNFYLGDEIDQEGKPRERHSGYMRFALELSKVVF